MTTNTICLDCTHYEEAQVITVACPQRYGMSRMISYPDHCRHPNAPITEFVFGQARQCEKINDGQCKLFQKK
jgi:hypothetical protein